VHVFACHPKGSINAFDHNPGTLYKPFANRCLDNYGIKITMNSKTALTLSGVKFSRVLKEHQQTANFFNADSNTSRQSVFKPKFHYIPLVENPAR
jgi:hypothetical protein